MFFLWGYVKREREREGDSLFPVSIYGTLIPVTGVGSGVGHFFVMVAATVYDTVSMTP